MHRRALPIASPCDVFRPSPGRTFCDKCQTHVHDLSELTRTQALRLLADHAGQRLCVAYRTTPDGTIVVRPEPKALGLVLVVLGLAACTGYAPDIQHPDEFCRDEQGYEVRCSPAHRDGPVIPSEDPDAPPTTPSHPEPVAEVEPIEIPTGDLDDVVGLIEVTHAEGTTIASDPLEATPATILEPSLDAAGGMFVSRDFIRRVEHAEPEGRRAREANRRAKREARRERRAARDR